MSARGRIRRDLPRPAGRAAGRLPRSAGRPADLVVLLGPSLPAAEARALAEKYFGRIPPSGKPVPDIVTLEEAQLAEEGVAHYQILPQKTLVQIAVHLPATMATLKEIKGIGKRLAAKFGPELTALVADYRQRHGIEEVALPEPAKPPPPDEPKAKPGVKEDTKKVSLELFIGGLTIPQVAAQRGLSITTIEGHIAFFVAQGELEIGKVVADEKRRAIEKKIADMRSKPLKDLKTALGDDCSYGEIKLVLAHLEHVERQ